MAIGVIRIATNVVNPGVEYNATEIVVEEHNLSMKVPGMDFQVKPPPFVYTISGMVEREDGNSDALFAQNMFLERVQTNGTIQPPSVSQTLYFVDQSIVTAHLPSKL